MRSRSDRRNTPPALDNVFSHDYLAHLRERDEVLTAAEAEYAGPWRCAPARGATLPGGVAVLREWEDPERDAPEGILWHEETARLLAIALPITEREPLFHLDDRETPEGFAVTAVFGEQGSQGAGWLRRYEPRLAEALHLLEGVVRSPRALADLLEAAGPIAVEQVGKILARRLGS
ncbi:MAG TPA: hypothetical protein VIH93_04355 [Thermoanaerobaculia bacterium]|jgi:hypothetical protein